MSWTKIKRDQKNYSGEEDRVWLGFSMNTVEANTCSGEKITMLLSYLKAWKIINRIYFINDV